MNVSMLTKISFVVLAVVGSVVIAGSGSIFAESTTNAVQLEIAAQGYYSAAPPTGFNPLTATNAELQQYGFPSRPTSPGALATWTAMMEHAKTYVPPNPTPGVAFSTASSGGVGRIREPIT